MNQLYSQSHKNLAYEKLNKNFDQLLGNYYA